MKFEKEKEFQHNSNKGRRKSWKKRVVAILLVCTTLLMLPGGAAASQEQPVSTKQISASKEGDAAQETATSEKTITAENDAQTEETAGTVTDAQADETFAQAETAGTAAGAMDTADISRTNTASGAGQKSSEDAAATTEQNETQKSPAQQHLQYAGSNYTVAVTSENGFADGDTLHAEELTEETDPDSCKMYKESTQNAIAAKKKNESSEDKDTDTSKENKDNEINSNSEENISSNVSETDNETVKSMRLFQIKVTDAAGKDAAYTNLDVTVNFTKDQMNCPDGATVQVVSFDDDKNVAVLDTNTAKVKAITASGNLTQVSFTAEKTGVYGIAVTGNAAQDDETESTSDSDGNADNEAKDDNSLNPVIRKAPAANAKTITIMVGDETTITPTGLTYGKKDNEYSWESSDSSMVSISSGREEEIVTVKGEAVGTVTMTLTHKYKDKKKDPWTQEIRKYTVTESEKVTDADATAQASKGDPEVTVKETGNLKKISGYHVVVQDADGEWESEEDFLKAYHIYLADKNGNEVSYSELGNGTLNLKVTLTYSELPEWFDNAKNVKHYNNVTDKTSQSINNVKFDRETKSISFIVHGFSSFVITSDASSETSGGTTAISGTSFLDGMTTKGANEWQIVNGKYIGNSPENKTVMSEDGNVRIQKNVISTDSENEFLVYLSIDRKTIGTVTTESYNKYLSDDLSRYCVGSASHFPSGVQVGEIGGLQGTRKSLTEGGRKKNKTYTLTLTYKGKTIGTGNFEADCSNSCLYLDLGKDRPDNSRYIALAEFKKETKATVPLSDEAYSALVETVTKTETTLNGVKSLNNATVMDELGNHFTYINVYQESIDGTVVLSDNILTWNIVEKSNPGTVVTTETNGNTNTTTTWYTNVAELVYKVKFTPTTSTGVGTDGKVRSIADTSLYTNTDNAEAAVNQSARLTYSTSEGNKTVDFPVPAVRGILHDVVVKKTDDSGTPLAGAVFRLRDSSGNYIKNSAGKELEVTSGADGVVRFPNLLYGEYTLEETKAPDGYKLGDTPSWNVEIPGNCPVDENGNYKQLTMDTGQYRDNVLWNQQDVQNAKSDIPLTGVNHASDGREILLTLLSLAAVAGLSFYYRKRMRGNE